MNTVCTHNTNSVDNTWKARVQLSETHISLELMLCIIFTFICIFSEKEMFNFTLIVLALSLQFDLKGNDNLSTKRKFGNFKDLSYSFFNPCR